MKLVRPITKRPMQFVTEIENGNWLVFNNLTFKKRPNKVVLEVKAANRNAVLEIRRNSLQGELIASCPIRSTGNEWGKQAFEVRKLKRKRNFISYFGMLIKIWLSGVLCLSKTSLWRRWYLEHLFH